MSENVFISLSQLYCVVVIASYQSASFPPPLLCQLLSPVGTWCPCVRPGPTTGPGAKLGQSVSFPGILHPGCCLSLGKRLQLAAIFPARGPPWGPQRAATTRGRPSVLGVRSMAVSRTPGPVALSLTVASQEDPTSWVPPTRASVMFHGPQVAPCHLPLEQSQATADPLQAGRR